MNIHLEKLRELNPTVELVEETDHYNVQKLWNDNSLFFRFEKTADLSALENLLFPEKLAAIYHKDTSVLEIIFTPLQETYKILTREFNFYFEGVEFKTSFKEPTSSFVLLANSFRATEEDSKTEYRNLERFRDYYKKDSLPNYVKKYFENRKPINFFIEGNFEQINFDFGKLAKYLNFYSNFYDRKSPSIILYEESEEEDEYETPCYSTNNEFPQIIQFTKLEPVLLDLFHVIERTYNPRLKFIFYFQILEYCAYYHLDDGLKKRLTSIIKRPDLINNSTEYSKLIIEEFKDHFRSNDDTAKLEKLITEFCNWGDVKREIETHKEYFSNNLVFDGGITIPPLINPGETFQNAPIGIMKNIKINIEKIRNVSVHLRESRENKVILPTPRNNHLLVPYLHLIQRIAEVIAINHG